MGDKDFKNSLKIFTFFEPTISADREIRSLVTIAYKMDGRDHKMEKEVEISKNKQSPTGYVFTVFKST
uniref:Uncharacterized protein n=1 Tax=Caenorhabditis tropicalis TaxID=1561998 RepID=A0A1I7U8L2_9PELO